eukprot:GHVO01022295.1.p1 GENE.GHVO01022295.1~~GHVO01022295.1.p1  ORF type:complete len:862 (+),score=122.83 GHVO01022295.1:169-2586(+)
MFDEDQWVPIRDKYQMMDDIQVEDKPSPGAPEDVEKRPTGEVVYIIDPISARKDFMCVIRANQRNDNERPKFVKAVPTDKKYPWILIPISNATAIIKSADGLGVPDPLSVYRVKIKNWEESSALPVGVIIDYVGRVFDLAVEEEVIMDRENLVAHRIPFDAELEREADDIVADVNKNWESYVEGRVDYRSDKYRVFTIDPIDARDFDDAIHIIPDYTTPVPTFEIGVHIADVAAFVKPGSLIDEEAKERTTTVYLPRLCYPMLPRALCEELCSLRPHEDKLTFTVVFRVLWDGSLDRTFKPKMHRSVIRSCARFNYEEVQAIVDHIQLPESMNDVEVHAVRQCSIDQCPDADEIRIDRTYNVDIMTFMLSHGFSRNFESEEAPIGSRIQPYLWSQLVGDLKILEVLTQRIRARRFQNGSLAISRGRLVLDEIIDAVRVLDPRTSSHELIEELMLLANTHVVDFLSDESSSTRDVAIVRNHKSPEAKALKKLMIYLESVGVPHDFSTAATTFKSILYLYSSINREVAQGVEYLFMKIMKPAEYHISSEEDLKTLHYALNFPAYTHFTSPIRRYADVMVHRCLSAALDLTSCTDADKEVVFDAEALAAQCNKCNGIRKSARDAQDAANLSTFVVYLREKEKVFYSVGNVGIIQDLSIVVFLGDLGAESRVYYNTTNKLTLDLNKFDPCFKTRREWHFPDSIDATKEQVVVKWINARGDPYRQVFKVFSRVPVLIVPNNDTPISFSTLLMPPWLPEYKQLLQRDGKSDDLGGFEMIKGELDGDFERHRRTTIDIPAAMRMVQHAWCDN